MKRREKEKKENGGYLKFPVKYLQPHEPFV